MEGGRGLAKYIQKNGPKRGRGQNISTCFMDDLQLGRRGETNLFSRMDTWTGPLSNAHLRAKG